MTDFPHKYRGGFGNNFDLMRLILATSVVFLHFDHLAHNAEATAVLHHTNFISGRAVDAFFVISGFVVFMSFDCSRDLRKYAVSRFLRLYPAYLTVVLLVAALPFLLSSCGGGAAYGKTWIRYLATNLVFLNFLQPTLPCLFQTNFDSALNGSLWTLKIEVMFYLVVPLLFVLVRRFGAVLILAPIYLLSLAYFHGLMVLAERSGSGLYDTLSHQLPGQMSFFSVGVFLYVYYERFLTHLAWFFPLSVVALFFSVPGIEPIALGVFIIAAATAPKYHVDLAKLGDLSYGIYVFHFPIIQLFLQLHLFEGSWISLFVAVLATTFVVALLSWRLIEQPAMRLKNRLARKRPVPRAAMQ